MAEPIVPITSSRTDSHHLDEAELLRITARHPRDDLVVLTVRGEIDLSNTSVLAGALARHEHVPHLVLELSGVDFCSVSGAQLLHATVMRSAGTGRHVQLVRSAAVTLVLDATGMATDMAARTLIDLELDHQERDLRRYAHDVAAVAGSSPESTMAVLEPTPDVYIPLSARSAAYPHHDVALVWNDTDGWAVAVETGPGLELRVLDHLGPDLRPDPPVVARFAERVLARADVVPDPHPPNGELAGSERGTRGF